MEELNELARTIAATDPITVRLDHSVKMLFVHKQLLSRVIKETVAECNEMTYEEIEACIEGEVQIDKKAVDTGLSNASERIQGLDKEMHVNEEGYVTFDLYTYLHIPGMVQDDMIKVYLNLEFMNEDHPGYDISLRALFYCCRMISMQEGVDFTTRRDDPVKYGNIKKVYSVWLCTESARKRANTIEKYGIDRSFLLGSNDDDPRYDIINAVIVYLSKTHDTEGTENTMIRMLTDLFNEELPGVEKVRKLKEVHGIPMTREIGREVPEVCTYAEAIIKKTLEKDYEKIERECKRADAEAERADAAEERADAEAKRADAANKRADRAEAKIKELEARLAALAQ